MIKRKVTEKVKNFLGICFLELFSNGLTRSEDIDFHLFFRNIEDGGYIFITLPFDISQLHTTTLFLRQLVDELPHQLYTIPLHHLFLWIRMMAIVRRFCLRIQRECVVAHQSCLIEREVSTDSQAKSLDIIYGIPTITSVPYLDHRFLYYILCLRRIKCDAEGKSEKFIFQW